jgi:hypothetical protein
MQNWHRFESQLNWNPLVGRILEDLFADFYETSSHDGGDGGDDQSNEE